MTKAARKTAKGRKGKSAASANQLDVVFDGTWVIVPQIDATRRIIGLNIYSPSCGHPQGVTFVSGPKVDPWPEQTAFYQLDNHGHTLQIQRSDHKQAGMSVKGIDPVVNHIVTTPRPIGDNWDLQVSIPIGPDSWVSSDTVTPKTRDSFGNVVPCFAGDDAPAGRVSSMQTLSFAGVTSVALVGAPSNVKGLLPSPWSGEGTLIFEDEIPYVPTLQHERTAIFAMANLAGLDLLMNYPLPERQTRGRTGRLGAVDGLHEGGYCGHSVIVIPS